MGSLCVLHSQEKSQQGKLSQGSRGSPYADPEIGHGQLFHLGLSFQNQKTQNLYGFLKGSSNRLITRAIKTALENTRMVSGRSLLPRACAVNPLVPIRRNPRPQ